MHRFHKKARFAEMAQLVEQRIRNAWVTGSSPVFGSSGSGGNAINSATTRMKTIFIFSRNADFTASRLMTETALTGQGYIDEGTYEVYDITASEQLGEMNAAEVIRQIKSNENAYRVKPLRSDNPTTFYVSARPLYE